MQKNLTNYYCRVCLENAAEYVMFTEAYNLENEEITLQEMFEACTHLEMSPDDNLPQLLCIDCSNNLKLSYEFILKAITADRQLRQLQSEEVVTTKDPLEDSESELYDIPEENNADDNSENEVYEQTEETKIETDNTSHACHNPVTENAESEFTREESLKSPDVPELDNNTADTGIPAKNQLFPLGRFKCAECNKSYFTKTGLKAHMEVHLPEKKTRKYKPKQKITQAELERLLGPSHSKQNDESEKDDEETDSGQLDEEDSKSPTRRDRSQKSKRVLLCPECGKQMKSKSHLNYHMVTHTGEKNFLCTICARSYSTIYKLRNHMRVHEEEHNKEASKPQKRTKKILHCPECGKYMKSNSHLKYHMVTHTKERNYLCTICAKSYTTIYKLKSHMRSHTGERPYECKYCDSKFAGPTTLKCHMLRHTGERPYQCKHCGKRFLQHSSMSTHIKMSHMVRTIECPHCPKKYARQSDLNYHLRSHNGDKPFICEICDSRFIRLSNLTKHMSSVHYKHSKANKDKVSTVDEGHVDMEFEAEATSDIVYDNLIPDTSQSIIVSTNFNSDADQFATPSQHSYEHVIILNNIPTKPNPEFSTINNQEM